MTHLPPPRALRSLIVIAILAVGAGFRFYDLGLARLSYDNSYPMYNALRILDEHQLLLVGQPSSVFLDNPPLMSYLQTIPLLVSRSPWAVYIFIVALNTIAIGLVYQVAKQLLGDTVGYLAAFLFAINPWVVYFSRSISVQALIPFWGALVAWGLWPSLATENRSPVRVLIAGLSVTAITQTYIQAWGVLAQIAPLVLLFRKKIPRKPIYIGLFAFAAAMVMYGIGLSEQWETNQTKLAAFFSGREIQFNPEGIEHAVRLVTGLEFDAQSQTRLGETKLRQTSSLVAYHLLSLALITGIVYAVFSLRRQSRERPTAIVLLVWFSVPILLTSISANPVHPHYLLLTCPAGYVLAGWGMSPLLRHVRLRWIALSLLVFTAIVSGFNLHQVSDDVARSPTEPQFDGWALEQAARVGTVTRELTESNNYPRRIVAEGQSSLLSSMSGVDMKTLNGLDFPDFVVLPGNEPLLYILVNTPAQPEALGPHQQSFPERDFQLADGTQVFFLRTSPYDRGTALALPAVKIDWSSESGLSILGYTLSGTTQPGKVIECVTYWRVDELHPGYEEWYIAAFYHFSNQSGQVIIQVDGHGQWARRWQVGDIYVERVSIQLPDDLAVGQSTLEISLFDGIHGQGYSLLPRGGPIRALSIPITVRAGKTFSDS